MNKKKILQYLGLAVLFCLGWLFSSSNQENTDISERTKIALRDVGNKLLLINKDSSSLVLPIKEVKGFKYKLSFQNTFTFEPNELVMLIRNSFEKAYLPNDYRVEVIQCFDDEVAYSYEVKNDDKKNIIPCRGRELPKKCYTISVKFTKINDAFLFKNIFLIALFLTVITFGIDYIFTRPKKIEEPKQKKDIVKIGSFQFYPSQNKLVKQASEIRLSKKECELLIIFVANQNQIVTREELTKKVWEDNGVFVGRSLDTYISKLRKILKEDASVKLVNVHGIGYKLEINFR